MNLPAVGSYRPSTKNAPYFFSVLVRWATVTASLAALLFFTAGTTQIASLRAYFALFAVVLLVTMVLVDPQLAEERSHPGRAVTAADSRFAAAILFLATLAVAALDVGRLHLSDAVPGSLRTTALFVFALSATFQAWAMAVNPFFSPVIRLQKEGGHRVVAGGPYRFVRHPGYLAMLTLIPASALAIGSCLALLPAAGFCLVVVHRTQIEDRFLTDNLPGYADYAIRVRASLFPRFAIFQTIS